MKLSHTKLVVLSGLVWLGIGVYLLQMGLGLLLGAVQINELVDKSLPLIDLLKHHVGGTEISGLILLIVALNIGYFKGRYVLGKSARRSINRIYSLPNPASLASIYSPQYYLLLGLMIALGMSMKFLGLSHDIRGLVDVAIGSALINGAMTYFREAQLVVKS